jgi:hypothetical protein
MARGFDEDWYLSAYPDVALAVSSGVFRSGYDHYKQFGRREGRLGKRPPFDEETYLRTRPDVRKAIERGEFKNGLEHFVRCGLIEIKR